MKDVTSIIEHLKTSRGKLLGTAEEISAQRWRESPGEGRLSASEVIAHLSMVEEKVISTAKGMLQKEPQIVPLLRRLHFPIALTAWRGARRKTPIPLDPNMVAEKAATLDRLSATRRTTLELIESTDGRDLSAYRFPHPFLGSLNIYDWLRMLGFHELRHEKQIREIVETFQR
jgi:hypothetical protein